MQFGADPQQGLTVSCGVRESAVVVQVRGELDYRAAPLLRSELSAIWDMPGISAIVLDLAEVTFCDSVGLSELIATLRRSQNTGHTLMVSGLQGTLLRVLTITGLHNAFDSYDTVEEALRRASSTMEPPLTEPSILDPPPVAPSGLESPAATSILEPPAALPSILDPRTTTSSPLGAPAGTPSILEPSGATSSVLEPSGGAISPLDPLITIDPLETAPAAQDPPTVLETPDTTPGNDLPPGPATPAP
ncbi:anti-sigma factor antagonist [Sphaerisporangium sp. NPDC049002]|uniref:STAS domain-containing protein n=1 Tax=unclassified Sphaerisporangium TaxID=2630420 RepID=UPI0033E97B9B